MTSNLVLLKQRLLHDKGERDDASDSPTIGAELSEGLVRRCLLIGMRPCLSRQLGDD